MAHTLSCWCCLAQLDSIRRDWLSVGDISIVPMIPATHTCSTVYAISEKVSALIGNEYSKLFNIFAGRRPHQSSLQFENTTCLELIHLV